MKRSSPTLKNTAGRSSACDKTLRSALNQMSRLSLFLVLLAAAPASVLLSLTLGSVDLPLTQVLDALSGSSSGLAHDIVWQLRMPRVAAAFVCGALLALAGALLQVLLRNPLADPYILGVSGGAAVGALSAILLGLGWTMVNFSALFGAMAAIGVVFGLSFRAGEWNLYRLLLTGVVVSAGCSALIGLLLVLAPTAEVKGMLFWLMGDLSHAEAVAPAWAVLLLVAGLSISLGGNLNVLSLGLLKAKTLGIAVMPLQVGIYFFASLLTVAALTLGGMIGFVGLVIPHAIRLMGATDHRWLLPMAILLGGSFLTLADTLARTLWAPQQLPVGVLTALLGVPMLLLLLSRKR